MKQYFQSIDFLRFLAILAVILIHTTTRTLEWAHYDLVGFSWTLLLNQAARFAVPLFFIISGFLLELNAPQQFDYLNYYKKRVGRIILPYFFWSAIYYLFVYNQNHDNLLKVILTGNASYQLYFIPTLCIYYLIFPLLHKIYRYLCSIPVLIMLAASQILLMSLDYFGRMFAYADPIRILLLSYFFFIAGMAAARHKEKIITAAGKVKYLFIASLPLLIFYIFREGYSRYFLTQDIKAFYSQWRPDVLIYTLVLATVIFYFWEKNKLNFKIITWLSNLSFFVFFVHVIILEKVWIWFGENLFFFPAVVFGSFGVAYLVHKIPWLSRLTG